MQYSVAVEIKLIDNLTNAMARVNDSLKSAHGTARTFQDKLFDIQRTWNSGMQLVQAGEAFAAPLVHAVKAATDLQTALGRVQIATGATNSQMSELDRTLTRVANQTGIFSKPALAGFAADMFASGITQMSQINSLLPLFAKGADLMKIMSHGSITPTESAHTFSALAHQFGRYTPDAMSPIVQAAVAIAPSLPGGLKTLKGMGSYTNVLGNRLLGIDPVELMALQAAVSQTSGGQGTGRGALSGANLLNALKRSMPGIFGSGLLEGKSAFAAATLGLADGAGASTVFKGGKFNLSSLMDKLSAFEALPAAEMARRAMSHVGLLGKNAGQEIPLLKEGMAGNVPKAQLTMQLLQDQYGTGSTLAQLFGDPKFRGLVQSIRSRIAGAKPIEQQQSQAMELLSVQTQRMQTNWTTLSSTIGTQLIPSLTKVVKMVGDFEDKLNELATQHPKVVQTIVGLTAVTAGAIVFGGALQLVKAGFDGINLVLGPIGQGFKFLGPALLKLNPTVWGITLAIGGLILVIKNWDQMMNFAKDHVGDIKVALAHVVVACQEASKWLNNLGSQIMGFAKAANGVLAQFHLQQMKVPDLHFGGTASKKDVEWADKVLAPSGWGKNLDKWAADRGHSNQKASGSAGASPTINSHNTINIHVQGGHGDKPEDHARKLSYELGRILPGLTQGDGVMQSRWQATG